MKLFDDDGSGDEAKIEIDEEYAKRYEHNKKREDLQRYEEMKKRGLIDDSDESDEESDDYEEDGGLVSGRKDLEFFEALIKVKRKDPILKEKEVKLFDSESEGESGGEKNEKKKKKKLYLKDVIAKQLLEDGAAADGEDVERTDGGVEKVKSLAEEQEEARRAFLEAAEAAAGGDDDDGEFLKFKESGGDRTDEDEEDGIVQSKLDEYFGSDDELDDNSKFLKEFFKNKLYVEKSKEEKPIEEELRNLSESEDEEVERELNYRFEENAGDRVLGHSRVVEGSVRKKVSARKVQRLSREQRRAIAEVERMEEVKHLKTLKKQEFVEKLKRVREVGGLDEKAASTLGQDDLEEEFDLEKHDRKMKQLYGEEYYGAKDVDPDFGSDEDEGADDGKPNFDKEDELLGLPKGWDKQYKDGEEELKEALYKLDYEGAIGDLKTRFKYTKVKPQRFGLSQEDILEIDDKKLNQYVSLKKIAPYREKEWKVPSAKKHQFKQEKKELSKSGDFAKGKKRLRENGESSSKSNNAVEDEVTEMELDSSKGKEPKKNRRKRQRAELKLSQSRLLAYGKIPSKSKSKA
uniref:Kri1-like C-terminal domain-containing protein n=1 Tax=Kalanchoe fedtschenkoi TaxID=63787 RepID=A0A7N0U0Y1_KALFE